MADGAELTRWNRSGDEQAGETETGANLGVILEAESLGKWYGRRPAVRDVNVAIRPGFLAVIGPNGAGKTTLLRMLAGILAPSRGCLLLDGRDVRADLAAYRDRVGYKPQNIEVYPHTRETVAGGLRYFARLKNIPARLVDERVEWSLETFGLYGVKDRALSSLSKGEKQRFFLAQAFLADPDIVILDEPTAGLDGICRLELLQLLGRLAAQRAVVVSTHLVDDIEPCDGRVLVLREGSVAALGPAAALTARAEGRVWEVTLSAGDPSLDRLRKECVVTAMQPVEGAAEATARAGEKAAPAPGRAVRLRLLADRPPHPLARPATPTLEEGYLALLRSHLI